MIKIIYKILFFWEDINWTIIRKMEHLINNQQSIPSHKLCLAKMKWCVGNRQELDNEIENIMNEIKSNFPIEFKNIWYLKDENSNEMFVNHFLETYLIINCIFILTQFLCFSKELFYQLTQIITCCSLKNTILWKLK